MVSIASAMMVVMSIASFMMVVMAVASTVMIVVAVVMVVVVMALVLAVFHRNLLDHNPGLLDRDGLAMFPGNLPAFLQRN